jgi:uncharacterized RDD family membrane protein YckC
MSTYTPHETDRMHELRGVPLASFTRRLAAFALDLLILATLFVLLAGSAAPLLERWGLIDANAKIVYSLNLNWYSVVWTVVYFGFATYVGNGKTPGKWIAGIRVVSLAQRKLSLWQSVERGLGYGASLLEGGFGFVQYFIDANRRTVHDRIAETIVIRQR